MEPFLYFSYQVVVAVCWIKCSVQPRTQLASGCWDGKEMIPSSRYVTSDKNQLCSFNSKCFICYMKPMVVFTDQSLARLLYAVWDISKKSLNIS